MYPAKKAKLTVSNRPVVKLVEMEVVQAVVQVVVQVVTLAVALEVRHRIEAACSNRRILLKD